MAGTISNCENYGEIEGTEYVAGFITQSGTATNCKNYAHITGVNYCGRNRRFLSVLILIVKTTEK